jgi:hypothetical protein
LNSASFSGATSMLTMKTYLVAIGIPSSLSCGQSPAA